MKFAIPFALISLIFVSGCIGQVSAPGVDSKFCSTDADCACGVHVSTGDCFYGNSAFVNVEQQCPDFCEGIGAHLEIVCQQNRCIQRLKQ